MDVLVIGGTGFIGPYLVRLLAEMGHSVSAFHRGKSRADLPAEHIFGDWRDLPNLKLKTDVVVDLILASGAQARERMAAFRGRARRIVAASSADVYRACGILHRLEDGPAESCIGLKMALRTLCPLKRNPRSAPGLRLTHRNKSR